MSHERKKAGQRKDKKNERMHDFVAFRKKMFRGKPHHSDQSDIQRFKPGGADDDSRRSNPDQPM
ncbi:MAG: hypothetical protein JST12_13515 [Armatimonadetes bacterium]|nr:hypothetical protein [Armatimonadota bacterium]MBS1702676.1 hypothetical protein [Armatimonadota bacterium]MBS1726645.1 hypothetical protein [Armatimonadota bacterium]